ncbi:MAG TPA: type IV pilus twitching motility protein PilT [Clostridiales bacterium]|nr:type IV pilus twitching motility protein PilT [Clostridiales bacterium]
MKLNRKTICRIIEDTVERNGSDLHISVGLPPICRVNGHLVPLKYDAVTPEDTEALVRELLNDTQMEYLKKTGDIDIAFSHHDFHRCRLNVFRQRNCYCLAFRLLSTNIQSFEELGLPSVLKDLCMLHRGLILVTGPTGTGKTTTLAAMVDWINSNRDCHIVTLEDPIEYVHQHKKSIVNQREIGKDAESYSSALRAVLRQDPDVILIGEMRDLDSISIALTAAETGHLVLSTLHTIGASKTIDRIIDVFPPYQQHQIRTQLSLVLRGVISQQLIQKADGSGRVAATEVMITTPAISNMIRENKIHQIANAIQTSGKQHMKSMDSSLLELAKKGDISVEDAVSYAVDPDFIRKQLSS